MSLLTTTVLRGLFLVVFGEISRYNFIRKGFVLYENVTSKGLESPLFGLMWQ